MKTSLKYTLLAGAIAACAGLASATPELVISTNWLNQTSLNTITVTGDATTGLATYTGGIGGWTINVDTGLTYPTLGSTASPVMDLGVVASGTGLLYVAFSDTGFTGAGSVAANFNGNTFGPSVAFLAFGGGSNALMDTSAAELLLAIPSSDLLAGTPGFNASAGAGVIGNGTTPYSLTEFLVVNGTGTVSLDAGLSVPDSGTTLMLLGAGLSVLGLAGSLRRRFIK
jgi:hypothetical protein